MGEDVAHGKPPAGYARWAAGWRPYSESYPLDSDFCELPRPPTAGRRRIEDPVLCDRQATSACLPGCSGGYLRATA